MENIEVLYISIGIFFVILSVVSCIAPKDSSPKETWLFDNK